MSEGHVKSIDGTSIAYQRQGDGPAVLLVGGGLDDGSENAPLATELAAHFTTYNYARRGRGESQDTTPYAVEREIEDIEALLTEAGGSAHVLGVSTGGALALAAAANGVPINRLAVYEVPYNVADDWPPRWLDYVEGLREDLANGQRGAALERFMRLAGSSDDEVAGVRSSPFWPIGEALAHTLAYDAACMGDGRPPVAELAKIGQPTLVLTGDGGRQPDAAEWVVALEPAANTIASRIPNAERQVLEGQGHVADPKVLADVLRRFYEEGR